MVVAVVILYVDCNPRMSWNMRNAIAPGTTLCVTLVIATTSAPFIGGPVIITLEPSTVNPLPGNR